MDKEAVLAYTANIRGRTFVKEVLVGDHNINVEFYDTYEKYKSANSQSMFQKKNMLIISVAEMRSIKSLWKNLRGS